MDYKKNTKDTEMVSHDSLGGVAVFEVTLSKKCERLATAIYLVTGFLSDIEPAKFRLRTLSLDLVRDASFSKNSNHAIESNVFDGLRANIAETLSLLEIAFTAGLVSEMNFTILKREYVALRGMIEVKKVSRESHTDSILGDNFFGVMESSMAPTFGRQLPSNNSPETQRPPMQSLSKGHSIGQNNITMSDRVSKESTETPRKDFKKTSSSIGQSSVEIQKNKSVRAITDVAKESRRARILKLIKDNREVTIKDIATHFADLSEKTIQRELVTLVESGVLKKFGERRWSRYVLSQR